MANGPLTPAQLEAYDRDGYVLAKRFFTSEETALLKRAAKEDRVLDDRAFSRGDGAGGHVPLSHWRRRHPTGPFNCSGRLPRRHPLDIG